MSEYTPPVDDILFTLRNVAAIDEIAKLDRFAEFDPDYLDALLTEDPLSRVACETMVTTGVVILAGEITSEANINYTQVVRDVIESAFDSAGQRCSALRILFVQDDIADAILDPLKGAMAMLTLGHPAALDTDIGPVISAARASELEAYLEEFPTAAVTRSPVSGAKYGHYVAPAVIELDDLTMPEREVFGPVLHVSRYPATALDEVIALIRDSGFALTLGLHSRIRGRAQRIARAIPVGNFYVNRNIIGAEA